MRSTLINVIVAAGSIVWIGRFEGSGEPPAPWRVVRLNQAINPTRYQLAVIDGVPLVEAIADSSMALLARPVSVDLKATPVLCWKWWIDAPVVHADMTKKSGDDYAVRVYVAFDMPDNAMSLGTRLKLALARRLFGSDVPDAALNYVWDNRHPIGTWQKSAYTDLPQLIVAETGSIKARRWVTEWFDVERDFARAFGGKPGTVVEVAVASDTDNTKSQARSAFAEIKFVSRSTDCER